MNENYSLPQKGDVMDTSLPTGKARMPGGSTDERD